MTRVCLVGSTDCDLHTELFSRETARDALSTYRLEQPYANTLALETIGLGSAVSLLNDLNWYLVRFTERSLVLEPSLSESEWLSRALATDIRENEIDPENCGTYLMVFDVESADENGEPPRLGEPSFVSRPDEDTAVGGDNATERMVVRITESEYEARR